MIPAELIRLQPTLPMIAGELEASGWRCEAVVTDTQKNCRGVRMFSGQRDIDLDFLYIITKENAGQFPVDDCAYLCGETIPGKASHICCPQKSPDELLEKLLDLFQYCQEQERRLDHLALSDAGLDELCHWAREFTGNPVCIHDNWFIILAMSGDLPEVMHPEHIAASSRQFIPQRFIDSFQMDADSRSHAQKKAWIWDHEPGFSRCICAGLWDEAVYQGQVLMIEANRPFRPVHFLAAECLAQRAALLLRHRRVSGQGDYRNMDSLVRALLEGQPANAADTAILLERLGWNRTDQYLCVRLQSQQASGEAVSENLLHSDLFRLFPASYIMFMEQQQCVILDISKERGTVSMVRHSLASLCRDYCLYAGISSPAWGIDHLKYAFLQADIALKMAFSLQNERWIIPFSTCALDYILQSLGTALPPGHLAAPELLVLLDHDQRKGTPYFATLRAFLHSERDIPRTSKALIIHRTTLLYRLKRIQDITGIDLDDPDQRLYLQLSLKLLEQSGARAGEGKIPSNAAEQQSSSTFIDTNQ